MGAKPQNPRIREDGLAADFRRHRNACAHTIDTDDGSGKTHSITCIGSRYPPYSTAIGISERPMQEPSTCISGDFIQFITGYVWLFGYTS
jgi:hypothetical protein